MGYPSRSQSRETPQLQPPAPAPVLPIRAEPDTPQLPEARRRQLESDFNRLKTAGHVRHYLGKALAVHRARVDAKHAARKVKVTPAASSSVAQAAEQIERAGMRPGAELSPRLRKNISLPPGAFMSRQKTTGGEVRRYKPPQV